MCNDIFQKAIRTTKLGIWATRVLKKHIQNSYSINNQLVALQERIDSRFSQLEDRVSTNEEQINFFIRTNIPPVEGFFYEGQVLDARVFAEKLIRMAQKAIVKEPDIMPGSW